MNFIFSNIFYTSFCEYNDLQKDNNFKLFFITTSLLNKLVISLYFEKLPLITKNGDIFSYKVW